MNDFKYIIWIEGNKIRGISKCKDIETSIDKVIDDVKQKYPNILPNIEDKTICSDGTPHVFCVEVAEHETGNNIACYYIIPANYSVLKLMDDDKYVFDEEKMERVVKIFKKKTVIWNTGCVYDASEYARL